MWNNLSYYEAFVGPFCKKDCLFCNEGGFGKRGFVSLEQFCTLLDENNFSKVVLTGGEPLLNRDIIQYVKEASQRWIHVGLVTAIIPWLKQEFFQNLVDAGLGELMISLEWPEQIHDALVQETGAYKNIIAALTLLGSIDTHTLKIMVHSNINKLNYEVLPPFISRILKIFPHITTYHLQMLEPFGSAIKNKSLLFDRYSSLIAPFFQQVDQLNDTHKIKFGRLPLCLVESKHRHFIAQTPDIYEQEDEQMIEWGYAGTKYESSECDKCSRKESCDRFFTHYVDMFGEAEIRADID